MRSMRPADAISRRITSALTTLLRLCFLAGSAGALLVPLADGSGPPDRLSADAPVGFGHLVPGNVGADGRGSDVEEGSDVAGGPPVSGKRLCHAVRLQRWDHIAWIQRLRCFVPAGALGPDDRDRDIPLACLGHDVGGATVSSGGLAVPHGEEVIGPGEHHPNSAAAETRSCGPSCR